MVGCQRVQDVLAEVLDCGYSYPRIDLAGVSFMDSSGLRTFLEWREQFRENDGDFEVVSVNPVVKRLFEVIGQGEIIVESMECSAPQTVERAPITDCVAAADNWAISSFTVAAALQSGKIVRDRVAQMATAMPFSEDQIGEIRLAVGEAMTNAVRHGGSGKSGVITVRCIGTGDRLIVQISDDGPGFCPPEPDSICPSGVPTEGGMGLMCMRQMADEVSFDFTNGTSVTIVKYIGPKPDPVDSGMN